ncbi:uncharacterized protein LOC121019003 isoform X2 [Herpailurus yagouaroundi]|uniref:uncharacterized protein LOC121019003 isoform X2 n=1 Tax=Herpailurus yagouaroundi TaxID=1608482 RepID=UPI001AD72CD8|nr:uncharacterized protein LOC121019003 isoform X2 [Puma yagouaroundi]
MRNRAGLGVRKSRRERRVGAGLVEGRVLPRPLGWPDTEQLGAGAGAGASASAPVAAGGGGACGSEGGGSGAAGFLPLHYPWPTASLCRTRGCVTAERVAEAEPVLQTKEPGTGSSYQISVFAEGWKALYDSGTTPHCHLSLPSRPVASHACCGCARPRQDENTAWNTRSMRLRGSGRLCL